MHKNEDKYWELENGRVLTSGRVVEVFLYRAWRPARVEFDHTSRAYILFLFDEGDVVGFLQITENTLIRFPER